MPTRIACPTCEESYRIEPARLPARRVRVACLSCGEPLYLRLVEVSAAAPVGARADEEVPIWKEPQRREDGTGGTAAAAGAVAAAPAAPSVAPAISPVRAPAAAPPDDYFQTPAVPRPAATTAAPVAEPPGVERPAAVAPSETAAPASRPAAPPPPSAPPPAAAARRGAFSFAEVGDAAARAQRLARALVSDILVYQPKKVEQGIRDGNLKEILRDEVEKSWDEYCERLGPEVARSNRQQFVAALNEILARGNPVF